MLFSIKSLISRRLRAAAVAAALATAALHAGASRADDAPVGSAYKLSFGSEYDVHGCSGDHHPDSQD